MSRLFQITLWVLVIVTVPVSALLLVPSGIMSPPGLLLSLPLGAVYMAAWILLLRLLAHWPAAGFGWAFACVASGIGIATAVLPWAGPISSVVTKLGWDAVNMSFGGAYPEEILKSAAVAVILLSFRGVDRPWHGLVTGALVGLGFETYENALYASFGAMLDPNTDVEGTLGMWLLRVVFGPGLHVMFTGLAGWGIGVALFDARLSTARRWGAACAWVGAGFALHFCWNMMTGSIPAQIAVYIAVALVGYPLFIGLMWRGHLLGRADREARPWHYDGSMRRRARQRAQVPGPGVPGPGAPAGGAPGAPAVGPGVPGASAAGLPAPGAGWGGKGVPAPGAQGAPGWGTQPTPGASEIGGPGAPGRPAPGQPLPGQPVQPSPGQPVQGPYPAGPYNQHPAGPYSQPPAGPHQRYPAPYGAYDPYRPEPGGWAAESEGRR
ncbi:MULTISPECIES: PrsW family glutamic-type intramembrane protease [Corynebacterium]|uniref:PrsW family intramembrane metalloprotease n=1 Tax=Corynebacterium TaxID=1716 RepID=UPI00254E9405|nr:MULTISPECIES: PrsW family glutamic-type intramembrane protease [Corynebacterium]MDK8894891.1 PrsW family glutamic-type intramembrane protease [Corynebacterium sp. MSK006]